MVLLMGAALTLTACDASEGGEGVTDAGVESNEAADASSEADAKAAATAEADTAEADTAEDTTSPPEDTSREADTATADVAEEDAAASCMGDPAREGPAEAMIGDVCFSNDAILGPPRPGTETIEFKVTLTNFLDGRAFPGEITVRACEKEDLACDDPIDETTTTISQVTLTLPMPADCGGFDGYLEVTGDSVFPSLLHYPRHISSNADIEVGLLDPGTPQILANIDDAELLPERGHLITTTLDCDGGPVAGASIQVDAADGCSAYLYTRGEGIPDPSVSTTDRSGIAAVINLPPTDRATTQTFLGLDACPDCPYATTQIRAGFMTFVNIKNHWREEHGCLPSE